MINFLNPLNFLNTLNLLNHYLWSMKKSVIAFGCAFLLFACSEAEDKLCDCIKVGNELNQKTHEILLGEPTEKSVKELKTLRKKKDKACKDFKDMSGKELMRRKETCEKK